MAPTWPINGNIPFRTHTPAQDQPGMQTNYANISGFLQVDHTAPGNSKAGQHNQVTLTTTAAPGIQVNPQSIVYTAPGVADTNTPKISELFYKNSRFNNPQIGFTLSENRGFGIFNGTGSVGSISPILQWNVTSITKASTGVYNVVMQSGVVTSISPFSNFLVLCTSGVVGSGNTPLAIGYKCTGAGQFTIYTTTPSNNSATDSSSISFTVLQI